MTSHISNAMTVGCGMDKAICESTFGECMNQNCKDDYSDNEKDCMQNAGMYTMGTTMMGGAAFTDSQKEACDCVDDADIPDRRKEELLAFYKKWAPDQEHKADTLLKKYSDNFPRLMIMLHQKYKHSVKVVDKDYKYKPEGDSLLTEEPNEPVEEEEQEL